MQTHVCYLKPKAPLHLQKGGGDHETVDLYPRSDTFSSALSYWWFRQYNSIPGFPHQMPFRFSSLFPAVDNGNGITRLYPKPTGITINPQKHDHKIFKKISWFSENLFEYWRNGNNLDEFLPNNADVSRLKRDGAVLVKNKKTEIGSGPLLKTTTQSRVTLDRVTNSSNLFHFVKVNYAPDVRLWFYADIQSSIKNRLTGLIRLLGDEGLGGDRTVGMGHFELQDIQLKRIPKGTSGKLYNLGIYNPAPEEVDQIAWNDSTYQLETRTGWVSGHSLRRKPVPCITENAVLSTEDDLKGNVPCVIDKNKIDYLEYSIYRDCQGYFIPC